MIVRIKTGLAGLFGKSGSVNDSTRRVLQLGLLAVGLACIGYVAAMQLDRWLFEGYQTWAFNKKLASRAPVTTPHASTTPPLVDTNIVGRIEVPRLGVSAMVQEGTDYETLQHAVGHVQGTALPGEAGNVGLAGHRDTFFRELRNVRKGDRIAVTTLRGMVEYRVESTLIVSPRDVQVLHATAQPTLTLVTCYPFYYIGSAPKRFIVRAVQVHEVQNQPTAM